ncbi:MAG: Na+/H+ antiporter NhaA [Pirellulaceae bacterium]
MTHPSDPSAAPPRRLPRTLAERWTRPFARFLAIQSASGVVLFLCTLAALAIANSPAAVPFANFWNLHLAIGVGDWKLDESLLHWVNDGLMTIFFSVVGLEIKREIVAGELRDPRKAALPIMAAIGGMLAPAGVYLAYLALVGETEGQTGWGIPMATDIAFVVGFLAVLGPRVPLGLKILLLSLAIADDIGAVLVIAVFYSTDISFVALGFAAAGLAAICGLNLLGVRRVGVYLAIGLAVWLAFLKSGVHPTVAGVMLGMLTPARPWVGDRTLAQILRDALGRLREEDDGAVEHHHKPLLDQVQTAAREAVSPLERMESALHPWVAFGIMPLFALANAGVIVQPAAVGHPVAWAVAAGLVIGKPVGIVLLSWLAVRVGIARLPVGVTWKTMVGAGCLAGIGFTMSLFIAGLALDGTLLDAAKVGTLAGSTVSAALGMFLLVRYLPR